MDSNTVKELMYGGIKQLIKHQDYYYHSTVGENYSHWTDNGKAALAEYMNMMVYKLLEAEAVELNQRAKQLVIKGLKGEQF